MRPAIATLSHRDITLHGVIRVRGKRSSVGHVMSGTKAAGREAVGAN